MPDPPVNSVFEEPWWLDAVAPGRWDEAVVRDAGEVVARLPYVVRRRAGLTVVGQPPLTQTLGPWLGPLPSRPAKRLGREKALLGELIARLPRVDVMEQDLSPALTYALPFHWAGFTVGVRYSYRLEDLGDLDAVWSGLHESARGKVRKAGRQLEVVDGGDLEPLLRLTARTLARAGASPVDADLVRRADSAAAERGRRALRHAVDATGRVHAVAYFLWDHRTTYYLLAGRDETLPNLGAPSLLIWDGIRAAGGRGHVFDFEGSMIEPVEEFFRAFGGRPVPYLRVAKASGRGRALVAARAARRRRRGV
jgi:hypothetical protein